MSFIISLTTTSERLELAYFAIKSLLMQTMKPQRILLNVSNEPFLSCKGITRVPDYIRSMESDEFRIQVVENTGPYRKLLGAAHLLEQGHSVITVDDDVIYLSGWLAEFSAAANVFSNSIVCGEARIMPQCWWRTPNISRWLPAFEDNVSMEMLPIGMAGILYKKPLVDLDFIRDRQYLKIAPKQDDLWFKVASELAGSSVAFKKTIKQQVAPIHGKGGLIRSNGVGRLDKKGIPRTLAKVLAEIGQNPTPNDVVWQATRQYAQEKYGL